MKVNIIALPSRDGLLGKHSKYFHMKYLIQNSKNDYNIIQRTSENLSKVSPIAYYQSYQYVKSKLTPDLCYFDDSRTGYLRYFLKDIPKTVFFCYDVSPLRLSTKMSLKTRLWIKFNTFGMKKAQRIITSSEDSKKEMHEYTGYPLDKINVVYCAVDPLIFKKYDSRKTSSVRSEIMSRYGIKDGEKILLYVGSTQPKKNVSTLIKAVHILSKDLRVKLLIVGKEEWPGSHAYLKTLISQLGIEKNIVFVGGVLNSDLPEFYNSSDVFICPSYRESFGYPNLEALSCGCPVVTTNTSCIPEVVGDAAIKLDDPFDHIVMAKKIRDILTNDGLRQNMSYDAVKQAAKFSWAKHAKEVDRIFEEVWKE